MTEEEKLERAAELRSVWCAEVEKRLKMTPEELEKYSASISDEGVCAGSFAQQKLIETRMLTGKSTPK